VFSVKRQSVSKEKPDPSALRALLLANGRDISALSVNPGPRGGDMVKACEPRRRGRHLHWYIGEFQTRPGIAGPVRCEEVPTFRTQSEARSVLAQIVGAESVLDPKDVAIEAWPPQTARGMHVGMPKGAKAIHRPSGLFTTCDSERSQHLCRDKALAELGELVAGAKL
jgi:hypothetical protein